VLELYGDLREAYGWKNAEIDALSLVEVEEIVAHWRKKPTMGDLIRAYFGVKPAPAAEQAPVSTEPRQISQAELDRILAEHKALADTSRGNPFR
jgi:hypothetical protein